MFKSEGTFYFCTKMYVKVRIHTNMYDMPRIDVQQSTTMYDNIRKYTNIYEIMFNFVRQCTTKNTSLRHKCSRTQKFYMENIFLTRGFSYEKLRITANKRGNLRKARTSCEFPIRHLSYLLNRKWDSTFKLVMYTVALVH